LWKESLQPFPEIISKERDRLQKEKEPSTDTVGSKDEKIESCGNKEAPDTNACPIKTVGKEKTSEQNEVKRRYVIPIRRNKDSAASSEKPKNFVEVVELMTAKKMMINPKLLLNQLNFLTNVKQIECAVIVQYKIAVENKVKSLIKKLNFYIKILFHKYCRN
jgi:hypothetical protein